VANIRLFPQATIALLIVLGFVAQPLPAGDIPVEGCSPGNCSPLIGSVPTLSFQYGLGSLLSYDFTDHAGTASDPWTISLGVTGLDVIVLFTPTFLPGGALTSPSAANSIPTLHPYGKYVLISLLDSGPSPWSAVFFDLQTTLGTISDSNDGISFGAPTPPPIESPDFQLVQILDAANALEFSGGTILPGQTAQFLLPITDGNLENGPAFFLEAEPTATPETSSLAMALAASVLLLAAAIFTSRGDVPSPQTADPVGWHRTSAQP
jgi:hypothetical protein